ncbi:DJ-1/PfpI family protein [Lactiplantibacillus plantarum]|uniref:DJ-1/PfpI family protein n=1 Tax=Lactiplantibacillus plantarum TaxID=1590 RepID=UPI003F857500
MSQESAYIQDRLKNNKFVGAICGAVDYLAKNGLLTNFKHTGNAQYLWKDFDQYQNKSEFLEEQTVRDNNLVTANGTAPLEFTKQVLKMIMFKNSEQIDKDIYLYEFGFYQYCKEYGNPFY